MNKIIDDLDKKIGEKKKLIKKAETKIETSPIIPYLNQFEDIFEERESEEDEGVEDLPIKENNTNMNDPGKTYQNMMGQIRKKKWGLNQRISYEPRKTENSILF